MRSIPLALLTVCWLTAVPLGLAEREWAAGSQTRSVEDRRGEAERWVQQGMQQVQSNQFSPALQSFQNALQLYREVQDLPGAAIALLNLGQTSEGLSQYPQALDFYQQALTSYRSLGNRSQEGNLLHRMGAIYTALEQYPQALEQYQQALMIAREVGDWRNEQITLKGLGDLYQHMGQYSEALAYYEQSLAITESAGDQANDSMLRSFQSLTQAQQAWTILQEISDQLQEGARWNQIGYALVEQDQNELAIAFLKQAVNVWQQIRTDLRVLPTEQQQFFTDTVEASYRQLATLLLQQDRILEAQQVLDLLKVQELKGYLKNVRRADINTSVEVLRPEQDILDRHRALQGTAVQLGEELADLHQKRASGELSAAEEQRRLELIQLQQELNQQFNQFAHSPEITTLIDQLKPSIVRQTIDLADLAGLQDNLKTLNAALFYPLILDDRIELVITTPTAPPLRRTVYVLRTDLNATIVRFRQALQDPGRDAKTHAQQLYAWLIAPIAADLKQANVQTILYAPDGQLRYIPLAALYDASQQQWLTQQYHINNITAKSLTEFDSRPQRTPKVLAAAFTDEQITYPVNLRGLPLAGTEVAGLSALIPDTKVLEDQAFSLAAVTSELGNFNILHFATHAAFVPGDPAQSFILFGNGDRLNLQGVETWMLGNVDLVVLSACETGLGGNYGNGEEILGLGYAFQARGARAVMASLWQVDDGGTQALMNTFYAVLNQGMTKAEALQTAQISLLNRQTANFPPSTPVNAPPSDYSHPYYWAPFILIGNGL